jgi:hypothetical protein
MIFSILFLGAILMSEKLYKVDRVCYERVFSVGSFESVRIRLEASVDPGVGSGEVVRGLAAEVADIYAGRDILPDSVSE